jgi:hypothetical protein
VVSFDRQWRGVGSGQCSQHHIHCIGDDDPAGNGGEMGVTEWPNGSLVYLCGWLIETMEGN